MDKQTIQTYTQRFQELIQKNRVDEVIFLLFELLDKDELTWKEAYKHFSFIPGFHADPNLKAIYYVSHKHGKPLS